MAGLAAPFVVNSSPTAPLNANAPSGEAVTQVSNFVTVQSFGTFAVAAAALKTIWELLKALAGGWADSYWTPLVLSLIYGAWQILLSVAGPNRVRGFTNIVSALFVGVANAGILAASIIGLTETTGIGGTE